MNQEKAKEALGMPVDERGYKCSLCGGKNHDRRTCSRRSELADGRRLVYVVEKAGALLETLTPEERVRALRALGELFLPGGR